MEDLAFIDAVCGSSLACFLVGSLRRVQYRFFALGSELQKGSKHGGGHVRRLTIVLRSATTHPFACQSLAIGRDLSATRYRLFAIDH